MVSKSMTVQRSGIIISMSSDLDKQMVRLKSPPFEEPVRSDSTRTFRVRGVPKDWTEDNLEARLTETYGKQISTVESLAVEYNGQWQTATVSFPSTFPTGESRIKLEGPRRNKGITLTVDDGFIGITTLHKPAPEDHKYDLIAVPGLGAHAFGSFKERGGDHMWLRDALPAHIAGTGKSNTRVMTYGYEASLSDSRNFQGLSDIGIAFMHSVFDATQGPDSAGSDSRPIIFVAHSLGGLVVKQALIALQESKDPEHVRLLRAVRGIALFGVPNDGMNIGSLKAMVGDRPNRQLLESIGSDADFLRRQYQDFQKFLQVYDPAIISFYETKESPTAQMDENGKWNMNGPHAVLVSIASATHCKPNGNNLSDTCALACAHSELVKFAQHDARALLALGRLEALIKKANPLHIILSDPEIKCLQSLAFPHMQDRANDVKLATEGTCRALDQGKPGSGKSTLLKHALRNQAAAPSARPTDLVLSFFFHGRGHYLQRTSLGLIRYLLHQVLEQVPAALQGLVEMSKKKRSQFKENEWHWNENELWPYFESAIPKILERRSVWLFTDALDECGKESATVVIERFLSLITKLSARASDHYRFRICFACRPYPVQDWKSGLEIHPEDNNAADISTFVTTQLSHVDRAISELVIRQASGVFLWVDLVVRKVRELTQQGTNPAKIQTAIPSIPQNLYSLYADLIQQMNAASLRMFQWVLFATRPLSLDELRWAMAIRPDHPYSLNAYTTDNENMSRQVQTLSCGLLEVTATSEGHVQFIHQSVKDFFNEGMPNLDSRFPPLNSLSSTAPSIGRAYYQLSRACILYLKMEGLHSTRLSPSTMFSKHPFLKYALTSWLTHTRKSAEYGVPMKDILELFSWPSNSLVDVLVQIEQNLRIMPENYRLNHISKGSSLVHIAARFGIQELLSEIIKSSHDHIDDRDEDGMTPLSFAAEKGHKAVVQLLLATKNVKIDSKGPHGKTPLSRAAGSGHDDVVELLLATNTVDVNSTDLYYGQTPLCWAAKQGHKAVVRLLLATNRAIADSRDENGRTPLSLAAENGHEAVVELLVAANNVDVNSKAVHGQTPLSRAAERGHEAVVRLLLATKNVDINSRDSEFGLTPLSWAAERGHEAVVRLLLATKNVDVDSRDSVYGQTPLSCAAEKGHEAVVRLLLARDGVNADSRDEFGRTPLSWAAENGHEAVVKLLVATNGVNVNSTDVYDDTLVHRAAERGHKAIAELLQMEIQRRGN